MRTILMIIIVMLTFAVLPPIVHPTLLRYWVFFHAFYTGWLVHSQNQAIRQDEAYHRFADCRCLCGVIHNWQNVLSNAPFLAVGLYAASTGHSLIWSGALVALAFCSAYYHWRPSTARLVWDRLPMAVAFMTLYAHWINEFVPSREYLPGVFISKSALTYALVALGVFSVILAAWSGDLRLYAMVQFYPMFAIPMYLYWFGSAGVDLPAIKWTFAWYILAKIAELNDVSIYKKTRCLVSGHALKHLFAAVAVAGATVTSSD